MFACDGKVNQMDYTNTCPTMPRTPPPTPATVADTLPTLLLALCYGAYYFLLELFFFREITLSRNSLWLIYLMGWSLVPPLAALSAFAMRGLGGWLRRPGAFYPLLLTCNGVLLAAGILGLHAQRDSLYIIAAVIPLANLLAVVAAVMVSGGRTGNSSTRRHAACIVFCALPLLCGVGLAPFFGISLPAYPVLAAAALLSSLFLFLRAAPAAIPLSKTSVLLDAIVGILIVLVVFDAQLHYDALHYNYYLGPTNDLIAGRSLLVDINCQYGVLPIYFLALIFRTGVLPLSYQGLSCLLSILWIVQYGVLYALLRYTIRSRTVAAAALAIIILVNYFSTMDYAVFFPSVSPLRFGPACLLLAAAMRNSHRHAGGKCPALVQYMIVGIASVWSLETFFYVLMAYLGVVLFESASGTETFSKFAAAAGERIARAAAAVALAQALLTVDILARAGTWPHWSHYWEYLGLFGSEGATGGYGFWPFDPLGAWIAPVMLCFASLMALVFSPRPARARAAELTIVAGMTTLGIAQFTYFIMRPHPNNLNHIIVPSIFLAAYWLTRVVGSSMPRGFKFSCMFCASAAAILVIAFKGHTVVEKADSTALYALIQSAGQRARGDPTALGSAYTLLISRSPSNPRVAETLALMERYTPGRGRVAIFITPDLATETLFLAARSHVYPMSNPTQDFLEGQAHQAITRVLSFTPPLRDGDFLFVEKDTRELNPLQNKLLARLNRRFFFESVTTTPHGIDAVRLHSRDTRR